MPLNQRSLLQLDVKALACGPPAPLLGTAFRRLFNRMRRLHLISIVIAVALAVYLLITAPSASTATETLAETPSGPPTQATETLETEGPAIRTASPAQLFGPQPATLALASLAPAYSQPAVPGAGDWPPEPDFTVVAPDDPEFTADAPRPEISPAPPEHAWVTATVKRHDTLSQIFKRHGLKVAEAYAVAELDGATALRTIRPGQEIQLAADPQGALAALRHRLDPLTTLHINRDGGRLSAETVSRAPEIRLRRRKAVIRTTLSGAAKQAGLSSETLHQFARLFDWRVDFSREIQSGDRFAVLFEERYLDGEKVGNGDIVAAELTTSGRRLRAIRHVDEHGRRAYYAPNGDSIQRSFLRSPVEFGRVTSKFAHKRFHPILKGWRAHRGVDYGAPRGTPVRATGDGAVKLAGRLHGYGKTVTIRHGEKYTTLYAHLNNYAKGIKAGARVRQGDIIGYVGSTGWSTGPHLHYEFRVNGVHQNPLTVELPKSDPIADRYKPEFLAQAASWVAQLSRPGSDTFAQLDAAQ